MTGKLRLVISRPFLVTPITTLTTAKEVCHFGEIHEVFSSGRLSLESLDVPTNLPKKNVTVCTFKRQPGPDSPVLIPIPEMVSMLEEKGLRFCEHPSAYVLGLMTLWPMEKMPKRLPRIIVAVGNAWLAPKIVLYEHLPGLFGPDSIFRDKEKSGEKVPHFFAVRHDNFRRFPDVEPIENAELGVSRGYLAEKI